MDCIYKRTRIILSIFHSAFSREDSFSWFCATVLAMLMRNDLAGVTSLARSMGAGHLVWRALLSFFASSAVNLEMLACIWTDFIFSHSACVKIGFESKLSKKVYLMFSAKTTNVMLEIDLRRRLSKHRYPEIGDYDVLAYFPAQNMIVIVECKFNKPKKCLKDDKKLFDEVFKGRDHKPAQAVKIWNRWQFMEGNWSQIFTDLNWPVPLSQPVVKSLYVSLELFWWFYSSEASKLGTCLTLNQVQSWIDENISMN